jgi:hypothetical protein
MYRLPFPYRKYKVNVHNHPSWASSRKEGIAWYSGRHMPSLWWPMGPKARKMTQHGGRLAGGEWPSSEIFVLLRQVHVVFPDGLHRLPWFGAAQLRASGKSSCCWCSDVHITPLWASSCQEGMGQNSSYELSLTPSASKCTLWPDQLIDHEPEGWGRFKILAMRDH